MKTKLLVVLWAVFDCLIMAKPSLSSGTWTYCSYPPWGGAYASRITSKMLDASPDWVDTEPNPPISARKAMRLAEATVRVISGNRKIDPMLQRSLAGVRLVPLSGEKWCWAVSYEWHRRIGSETGSPFGFCVYVLMNGKVVQPEEGRRSGAEAETEAGTYEKDECKEGHDKKTQKKDRTVVPAQGDRATEQAKRMKPK